MTCLLGKIDGTNLGLMVKSHSCWWWLQRIFGGTLCFCSGGHLHDFLACIWYPRHGKAKVQWTSTRVAWCYTICMVLLCCLNLLQDVFFHFFVALTSNLLSIILTVLWPATKERSKLLQGVGRAPWWQRRWAPAPNFCPNMWWQVDSSFVSSVANFVWRRCTMLFNHSTVSEVLSGRSLEKVCSIAAWRIFALINSISFASSFLAREIPHSRGRLIRSQVCSAGRRLMCNVMIYDPWCSYWLIAVQSDWSTGMYETVKWR